MSWQARSGRRGALATLAGILLSSGSTLAQDVPLTCDNIVNATISAPLEVDRFTFSVVNGENVEIHIARDPGSAANFQLDWFVRDGQDNLVGGCGPHYQDGDDCGPLPASGNPYRVEVNELGGDALGSYRVHFYRPMSSQACEDVPLACNQAAAGAFAHDLDRDLYSFSVTDGERVEIMVTGANAAGTAPAFTPGFPGWRVLDASGAFVAPCSINFQTGEDCGPLPASGNPLFYLLQNPNTSSATATVRYLLPFGIAPIERTYELAPNSRTTIPVDGEGPELASTDVSAVITAPQPIIVERAMYYSRPGQVFGAGHGSAGVTAASTSWFLAEGATGPFFDAFVLLANPDNRPAEVSVNYLLLDGTTFAKSYGVPANGRFTIWVDDEEIPFGSGLKPLDNVAVSSTITSTNGVPIIVERTMWWPSPALTPNFWTESHNSPGATITGTKWALAEGEVGGSRNAETYILIANTSAFDGSARVRLFFEDGTTAERTFPLLPRSRTNVSVSAEFAQAAGKRFGAVIESLGATPAQIVVERAMYTSPGGIIWAAGTNALATPLP